MKAAALIVTVLLLSACAPGRIKQYEDLLDPLVGQGTRPQIDGLLGKPKECSKDGQTLLCEYRTVGVGEAMNSGVDGRAKSFSPFAGREIAEQQNSDVLQLRFDYLGKLKEWKATAIMP